MGTATARDRGLARASASPIWLQLLRMIEVGIETGQWAPGDRLPSEHQLCDRFGISRTTVRLALEHLESGGLIRREQGRGAYVQAPPDRFDWMLQSEPAVMGEQIFGGRSALTSTIVRCGRELLPSWAAAIVGDADGSGFVVERVRAVGGRAAVHVVNHLPSRLAGIAPSLRDPHASLYAAMEEIAHVRITRMSRTIEAVAADRHLARVLELEAGEPIVIIEAVAYDQSDCPVDASRAAVRTDRMRVSVDSANFPLGAEHGRFIR